MYRKSKAFSLAETLFALSLIGVLYMTAISMNNPANMTQSVAEQRLAQVDSALYSWGKSISKANETGLGSIQTIVDDNTLRNSLTNYLATQNTEFKFTEFSTSMESYGAGFTEITLNNGVVLSVKYNGIANAIEAAGGVNDINVMKSALAIIVATLDTGKVKVSEEYALTPYGIENLANQFEGWKQYQVIALYNENDVRVGNAYCKTDSCHGHNCTIENGCIPTNTNGKFVYENITREIPCSYGLNGSVDLIEVASVGGVYNREEGICCGNNTVPNASKTACVPITLASNI